MKIKDLKKKMSKKYDKNEDSLGKKYLALLEDQKEEDEEEDDEENGITPPVDIIGTP